MADSQNNTALKMYQQLCKLNDFTDLIQVSIGYMLALFPFNWALSIGLQQCTTIAPLNANFIIDIGELLGFGLAALFALAGLASKVHKLPIIPIAFLSMAIGSLILGFNYTFPTTAGSWLGDILVGCGYALSLSLWLTLSAKLPPKKMLIVLSVGYLFNLVSFPIITDVSPEVCSLYAFAASLISALLFINNSETLSAFSLKPSEKTPSLPHFPPARLLAFCIIIPLAYGFCTNYLSVGVSTLALKIGFALPAVIIALGLIISYQTFSLSSVYWIACPFMTIGLLSTFFLNTNPMLSKALVTTALSGAYFVAYIVVRVQSQEQKRSPLFSFAVLTAVIVISTLAGKTLESFFSGSPMEGYVIAGLILAVVLSYGLLIARGTSRHAADVREALSEEAVKNRQLQQAHDCGLSERETTVYELLLEDQTVTEIANTLFIAPSTVRAHISRIYSKFGVHTRQELQRKMRE